MVEQSMGWLDEIKQRDGLERWLELVETLRQVTEGKVIEVLPVPRTFSLMLMPDIPGDAPSSGHTSAFALS